MQATDFSRNNCRSPLDWRYEDCRRLKDLKKFFGGELISKTQWAFVLGVDRKTLQRWEREIIVNSGVIAFSYYKSFQFTPQPLDGYRRFILSVVCFLKKGWITRSPITNEKATQWLKANYAKLNRVEFNKWMNEEVGGKQPTP